MLRLNTFKFKSDSSIISFDIIFDSMETISDA